MSSESATATPSDVASSADALPDAPERRDRVVEEVHRDLGPRLTGEVEAERLDSRQAAVALPDARGDATRDRDVVASRAGCSRR